MMSARESADEKISALVDGEIDYCAIDSALIVVKERSGQESWDVYHHIGDVLRSDRNAGGSSDAFMQRFKMRFEDELPHGQPVRVVFDIPKARPENSAAIVRPSIFSALLNWRFALPGAAALGAAIVTFISAPILTISDISQPVAIPKTTASSAGIIKAGNDGETVAVKLAHPAPMPIATSESNLPIHDTKRAKPTLDQQPHLSSPSHNDAISVAH